MLLINILINKNCIIFQKRHKKILINDNKNKAKSGRPAMFFIKQKQKRCYNVQRHYSKWNNNNYYYYKPKGGHNQSKFQTQNFSF